MTNNEAKMNKSKNEESIRFSRNYFLLIVFASRSGEVSEERFLNLHKSQVSKNCFVVPQIHPQ